MNIPPPSYYLPTHLAFLNSSRWLNFWDILYYTAYQQSAQVGSPIPTSSCCVNLTMTTHDFSRLLFAKPVAVIGATLTPTQRENGRKTFTQLLALAHQHGFLVCQDSDSFKLEDDHDQADPEWAVLQQAAGSAIIAHHFDLPLYQNTSTASSCGWKLIAKPNSYVEKGWLAALGSSQYARQLLNLWLSPPNGQPEPDPVSLQSEAVAMTACYAQARLVLPLDFKQPLKALPLLQRQLREARINLRERGLLNPDGQWDSQLLQARPSPGLVLVGLRATQAARLPPVQVAAAAARPQKFVTVTGDEATKQAQVAAQLLIYANKDGLRAARLQQLWETGSLEPSELKAVWRTLPRFWDEDQFKRLQWALGQRVKVAAVAAGSRQLSWAAIVAMARVIYSKQGLRNHPALALSATAVANQASKTAKGQPAQVQKRMEKLVVPPLGHGPLVIFIQPRLQAYVAEPRRLGRVRLEGWAHVPLWRGFAEQSDPPNRPSVAWVVISLWDLQGQLIFADEPRLITPTQTFSSWKVPLDQAFVRNWWRKQDFPAKVDSEPLPPLFRLEVKQVEAPPPLGQGQPNVASTIAAPAAANWYNLSLRLTFFPRRQP